VLKIGQIDLSRANAKWATAGGVRLPEADPNEAAKTFSGDLLCGFDEDGTLPAIVQKQGDVWAIRTTGQGDCRAVRIGREVNGNFEWED